MGIVRCSDLVLPTFSEHENSCPEIGQKFIHDDRSYIV